MPAGSVIFQCSSCRSLVGAASAELDAAGERAGLRCDVCGAVSWLPRSDGSSARARPVDMSRGLPSRTTDVSPEPEPLSSLPVAGSSSLSPLSAPPVVHTDLRARVADKLDALAPPSDNQAPIAMGFERLLSHWGSTSDHKRLLQLASQQGELAFLGQRYRVVLDSVPDDAQAKAAQGEILTLAMAAMAKQKDLGAMASEGGGRGKFILAAAVILGAVLVLVLLLPKLNLGGERGGLGPVLPEDGADDDGRDPERLEQRPRRRAQ